MRRQFFLDHVERDLLRVALFNLRANCNAASAASRGQERALQFTTRRIDELLERFKEVEVKK